MGKLAGALGFRGFSGTVWTITMEYLLTQLGYFIMLPILPFLLNRVQGMSMAEVGTVMLFFTLMIRGSSMLLGNLADRFSIKGGILASLLVTAICFGLLPLVQNVWLVYLILAITGFGISLNFTMSKALVAADVKERSDHVRAFGLINLFVNVSAAVGPVIGTFFLGREQYATVLLFIAGCYVAAFLLILFFLKGVTLEKPEESGEAPPRSKNVWGEYVDLLFRDRAYRKLSFFNFIGWFLYGQLFTGIPLFVAHQFELGTQLGTLFTVNAVLIVTLQMLVAKGTSHLQKERGFTTERLLLISYLFFAGSFVIVGAAGAWLLLLYVSVAVFTFGEMLFTPMSSTIASSMAKPGKRVLYFNALNVSQALGEGLGVYLGVAVLNWFITAGMAPLYWYLLGAVGLLAAGMVQVSEMRSQRAAGSGEKSQAV